MTNLLNLPPFDRVGEAFQRCLDGYGWVGTVGQTEIDAGYAQTRKAARFETMFLQH